jgi:hypothetical protein
MTRCPRSSTPSYPTSVLYASQAFFAAEGVEVGSTALAQGFGSLLEVDPASFGCSTFLASLRPLRLGLFGMPLAFPAGRRQLMVHGGTQVQRLDRVGGWVGRHAFGTDGLRQSLTGRG